MSILGLRIAEFRKKMSFTQQKLSELAGVDYNTLRKIETGMTKNPGQEIIVKIASALSIPITTLIEEPKPTTFGEGILPFLQLSPDRFESLVLKILSEDSNYRNVEPYGGMGDKKRDVLAKMVVDGKISDKSTLFQAKRHKTTSSTTLNGELDKIKIHFFDTAEPATPIEGIVFCLADVPSPIIKDRVKECARALGLPEPIFWDARLLDVKCHASKSIMNEYFRGHLHEIKEGIENISSQLETNLSGIKSDVKKSIEMSQSAIADVKEAITSFSSADDAEMQRARRLIGEGKYTEAKEILLTLKEKVEKSNDSNRLKKLYNNLGLCFAKSGDDSYIIKGIELLEKALDIDNTFSAPKRNLISVITDNGLSEKYKQAVYLGKQLYESEPYNSDFLSSYIFALNASGNRKDARAILESISDIEKRVSENEGLCVAAIIVYFGEDEFMQKAGALVEIGLKSFPDSPPMNRFKGSFLMYEAEKKGYGYLGDDPLLIFKDLDMVSKAVEHFERSLSLMENGPWPEFAKNQVRFFIYNTRTLLHEGRREQLGDLLEQSREIEPELLSDDEKRNKLLADVSLELHQKNSRRAYELATEFIKKYNCSYESVKKIARNFLQYGAVEQAIKFLTSITEEAKEAEDFECWALLSQCYLLIGDKNSALRVMNESKTFFASKNPETFNTILSHYGAVAARYKDNSESSRLLDNIWELQKNLPNETILKPIKAIEEDGSLSPEIKNILENAKEDFESKRDLLATNPVPVYFLMVDKMFGRSFPEVLELPRESFDFSFVLPYNQLDNDFAKKQKLNFDNGTTFVLDYSALLNLARSKQLGLFAALGKKVVASEHLLWTVQRDLIILEDSSLREAWNFLRSDLIELFPHREQLVGMPEKMRTFFETEMKCQWLTHEIDYCIKNDAVLITDDLRLWHYMYSTEVKSKAVNSFIFFQEGLSRGALDVVQYSLVIAELADLFYHFLPFNGENFLHIILEDDRKIEQGQLASLTFKYSDYEFKISRRAYHLLNQVKLPGANTDSFLQVCLEFISRLAKLSVLEKEKISWVMFLTNFFSNFRSTQTTV